MEAVEMWLWKHILGIKWTESLKHQVLQLVEVRGIINSRSHNKVKETEVDWTCAVTQWHV